MQVQGFWGKFRDVIFLTALLAIFAMPCGAAITVGHVDDFQDGTTQSWRVGSNNPFPANVADAGPDGVGDHSLYSTTEPLPNLIVFTDTPDNSGNWEGDWTAAGVGRISLDVRNPTEFDLSIRLGIAGPGGVFGGGSGDTYATDAIVVPSGDTNAWHSITFNVLAEDFHNWQGIDIDAALTEVGHFRVFHNPSFNFIGTGPAEFYLDNILALAPAPAGVPGDYNGNGMVDAADYTIWRQTLGQSGDDLAADGTGPGGMPDGVVDVLDYDFWKTNFGNAAENAGHHHGLGSATQLVPEPTSLLSSLAALAAVSLMRPKRGVR